MNVLAGLDRITFDPKIMTGQACIRGMRIPVSIIVNLIANGLSPRKLLQTIPILNRKISNKPSGMQHGSPKNG